MLAQANSAELVARRRDQAAEVLQTGQAGRGHAAMGGDAIWLLRRPRRAVAGAPRQ